jgi:phosphatidylinositol glycan class H protein
MVLMVATGVGLGLLVYQKVTQVLWGASYSRMIATNCIDVSPPESVLVLPSYGIQLETHRGLPSLPLFVSRRFIPLTEVRDVLINEGLRRWDVRYYLAILYSPRRGEQRLEVAYQVRGGLSICLFKSHSLMYQNILPRFPVLIKVYHGIHECLQSGVEDMQNILNM